MTPSSYVREHQKLWALRSGKVFDDAGYVLQPDDNLFEPLSAETIAEFNNADGQELNPKGKNAAKMNALHSSSALAVNVFHYWRNRDKSSLAKALKIPSVSIREIRFEELAPISENVNRKKFPRDPNIDVVIEYQRGKPGLVGIESKFSEAYGKHEGLKDAYLEPELWDGLPNCLALAKEASVPKVDGLNTPQLLKHLLGMKQSSGVSSFWLVYLWYASSGPEFGDHYSQLDEFIGTVPEYQAVLLYL